MSELKDWINAETTSTSVALTRELLDDGLRRVRDHVPPPRHHCETDGHVGALCSLHCAVCGVRIRDRLSVDENHLRYGEFF